MLLLFCSDALGFVLNSVLSFITPLLALVCFFILYRGQCSVYQIYFAQMCRDQNSPGRGVPLAGP